MYTPFAGKVAVVTGGNSGIGKSIAVLFARQGARVVIAARRVEESEQVVQEIRQAGGEACFVKTDVVQAAEVEALVEQTVARYGRLDCAVNNAGLGGRWQLHETPEEEWDRSLAINLKGVFLGMKYQIAQMLRQGLGGAIVNVSSSAGTTGYARNPAYSAAKHGVIGVSKSAALQYINRGIRINAVVPGVILTPMIELAFASSPQLKEWFLGMQPTGSGGHPDQLAQAVTWLCSEAASLITGAALPVDGGASAGMW
jgi:NAD(P)-dependent dehydrogenase (short-subunit alcohol dehydrogenase family)